MVKNFLARIMTLRNFSCIINVSDEYLTEDAWIVSVSDDDQAGWNGYSSAAFSLLLFFIGILWNGFVLITILWKRLLTSPIVILMFNLSVTNMMVCVFILPFIIVSGFYQEFMFGLTDKVRCGVCTLGIANVLLLFNSILTLSIMSMERFLYLKLPIKYHLVINNKRTIVIICIGWICSILISLPPLFGFGSVNFAYVVSTCVPLFVGHSHLLPNFYYAVFATGTGLIAFLVLIVMYIWIVIIARKHFLKKEAKITRNSEDNIDLNESYRNGRNSTKVYKNRQLLMMKLFVFIVTANILLWLPLFFLAIFGGIFGSHRIPTVVYSIAYFSLLSGIVIHPAIQTSLISELRMVVVMVWLKLNTLFVNMR